mmetsp:Transcript_97839/g.152991  ORF Transcript_97839/g.152991 Transcript_97839/m.152991 type:complete len:231 (+) Transcript_97839:341-1033(+)
MFVQRSDGLLEFNFHRAVVVLSLSRDLVDGYMSRPCVEDPLSENSKIRVVQSLLQLCHRLPSIRHQSHAITLEFFFSAFLLLLNTRQVFDHADIIFPILHDRAFCPPLNLGQDQTAKPFHTTFCNSQRLLLEVLRLLQSYHVIESVRTNLIMQRNDVSPLDQYSLIDEAIDIRNSSVCCIHKNFESGLRLCSHQHGKLVLELQCHSHNERFLCSKLLVLFHRTQATLLQQ